MSNGRMIICIRYDELGIVDDETCDCWDCKNPMGFEVVK